jgi:hypothetical protein
VTFVTFETLMTVNIGEDSRRGPRSRRLSLSSQISPKNTPLSWNFVTLRRLEIGPGSVKGARFQHCWDLREPSVAKALEGAWTAKLEPPAKPRAKQGLQSEKNG